MNFTNKFYWRAQESFLKRIFKEFHKAQSSLFNFMVANKINEKFAIFLTDTKFSYKSIIQNSYESVWVSWGHEAPSLRHFFS